MISPELWAGLGGRGVRVVPGRGWGQRRGGQDGVAAVSGCDDCPSDCAKHGHSCPPVKRPCQPGCIGHGRECPQRVGGDWRFSRRKGVKAGQGKAKLLLVLPGPLIAELRAHRRRQAAERLAAGLAWQDWDLVFSTPTGSPIDSRSDWADWHELLKEAGVRKARVHDARDTAATLLLEQGVGIRVVQQILGHSQVSQTERYTHVTTQLGKDAAARMAGALWRQATSAQLQPELQPEIRSQVADDPHGTGKRPGQGADDHEWGGWGSNPRPADYESAALTG